MRSLWISQLWILAAVFYDAGGEISISGYSQIAQLAADKGLTYKSTWDIQFNADGEQSMTGEMYGMKWSVKNSEESAEGGLSVSVWVSYDKSWLSTETQTSVEAPVQSGEIFGTDWVLNYSVESTEEGLSLSASLKGKPLDVNDNEPQSVTGNISGSTWSISLTESPELAIRLGAGSDEAGGSSLSLKESTLHRKYNGSYYKYVLSKLSE
ncbi:uncharacterized protein [Engystomops pustulosus]|uniref:uncharacterized protein n=1 Tax=Engystomops pustulosus TaxID=76066 RepID=UPI003AFB6369